MKHHAILLAGALVCGAALASASQAATLTPSIIDASSAYPGYPASDAVDGAADTDWAAYGEGDGAYIDFDLGADYALSSATVTDRLTSGGGNGAFHGGTTDFTTELSITAYTSSAFTTPVASEAPEMFSKTTPASPTQPSDFTTSVPLSLTGEYLRYTVVAANGPNPGLANISFDGVSAAPEPSAWVLMIAGVGLVGLALRTAKRRQGFVPAV